MHGAIISGLQSLPGFSNNKKCSLQMRDWKEKTPTTKSRANQVGKRDFSQMCLLQNYVIGLIIKKTSNKTDRGA